MPVRIYDIARRLGIENKAVLAKAKELGIAAAKVPSSSLDKITAEYLLEQIVGEKPPPEIKQSAPPPVPDPILIVKAPEPPPSPAPSSVPELDVLSGAKTAPSKTKDDDRKLPGIGGVHDDAFEGAEVPGMAHMKEAAALHDAGSSLKSTDPSAQAESPPAAEPEFPEPPPPPPGPKLGEKVGFINLAPRPGGMRGAGAGAGQNRAGGPARPAGRPGSEPQPLRGRPDARDMRGGPRGFQPVPRAPGRGMTPAAPSAAEPAPFVAPETGEIITLKPPVIVRDLAEKLNRKPYQLIADLIELKVMATVNQAVDEETAKRLCAKYGFRFEVEKRERGAGIVHTPKKVVLKDEDDKPDELAPRAPVVTIMGHVDHGKTTLLDVIRKTNVAAGEAGGITQHIGAYTISVPHPDKKGESQQITFLDTPGHAAFSAMRARGADVTDIVILVVAANDGIMPQTIEALNHAQAASVPIIVAVNKCDHPNANPMKVRQQLQEKGLVPDDWGGETIFVDVSALTKQGVDKLLEMIVLQADLLELKANPKRPAKGNVIESGLSPGGPTASVLVRTGTLTVGQTVICGNFWGRVRALTDDDGSRLKEAAPSRAVKILGLNGVPEAGLEFNVVQDEKTARALVEDRKLIDQALPKEARGGPAVDLDKWLQTLSTDMAKELKVVVKADMQGSLEAIVESLKKIESDKVSLKVIHHAVGTITETDVHLASASKAIILGFHTRIDNGVSDAAKRQGVQIKLYSIIYELIDQVRDGMTGLLDPVLKETVVGSAGVRKIFELSKGGKVAGCIVDSGRILKGKVRVVRGKNLLFQGVIQSLRRFQDEVNEVRSGMECGIRIDGFHDFQPGDAIECLHIEKVEATL